MKRRTVIIVGIILGIIALGIGAYFAWQNRKQVVQIIPGIMGVEIPPAQQAADRLKALSSREVVEYWVVKNATSSNIFYLDANKNIIKIDEASIETTDAINLLGVISITPSPSGKWIFAGMNKSGDATVYDVENNTWERDLMGVKAIAWGVEEGKFAILTTGTDQSLEGPQIKTGNISNRKLPDTTVMSFNLPDFDLVWSQKDSLLLTQKPSADYVSDMWKVDIATKKLSKFLSDRGLMVQWSSLGDRALKFTTTEGRNHKLAIIDEKGAELMALRFITMPDKCAITTPTQMYCAIPRDQEALSHMVLPDEYLKREVYFQDGIYQIDLATNGIRAIYEDEEPVIDATNLTVLEDRILFINRYDRKLYSLKLQ